jgi:predicted transcriptional regulator
MSKSAVVTARLDQDALAKLEQLSTMLDRSRSWIVAKAVQRYVDEELEFRAFVQQGIDEADRGEMISQEEIEAWFEARHRQAAAE